jgi:hypothetical protein
MSLPKLLIVGHMHHEQPTISWGLKNNKIIKKQYKIEKYEK